MALVLGSSGYRLNRFCVLGIAIGLALPSSDCVLETCVKKWHEKYDYLQKMAILVLMTNGVG